MTPRGLRQRHHRSLLPRCCTGHAAPSGCHAVERRRQLPVLDQEQRDARGGDMGLEGWATEYCMPMADDPATTDADESVVCTGDDATFTAMTDADGDPAHDRRRRARGRFPSRLTSPTCPPWSTFVLRTTRPTSWTTARSTSRATRSCTRTTGSSCRRTTTRPMNTDELDKGPAYITYTTQSIYVGAHRELDDRTGSRTTSGSETGTTVQADTREARSKSG